MKVAKAPASNYSNLDHNKYYQYIIFNTRFVGFR